MENITDAVSLNFKRNIIWIGVVEIYVRMWITHEYCHVLGLDMGFGLEVGFIDHFNTWLVTAPNYSAITDVHTLQISTAHTKSFQFAVSSPVVHW
jgi:hypothetical protein